jgi:hypothetical protein
VRQARNVRTGATDELVFDHGVRWPAAAIVQARYFPDSPLPSTRIPYIQFEPGLITADGQVTNSSVEEFLRNYMTEFHAFIGRVYTALPRST